ncbi:hypothetical protein KC19_VG110300 [Ceratodon purpureus]|uniref:Uncharacterized protein n=1 Tax=Ceratodon purpureus TaxID=3225 RepID=A0A8T0HP06_CERPU|nr:hypothetical protein KC19_VG110300 [Ceratodon purpureus]
MMSKNIIVRFRLCRPSCLHNVNDGMRMIGEHCPSCSSDSSSS